MILVIDAYNILKVISANMYVDEQQRNQFLQQLGLYGKLKGHKIVVVFDGGPSDRPLKDHYAHVYVVYSGCQQSADDYIRFYVEKHKNDDVLVISSDSGVRRYVAQLGIESLDSLAFYSLVKQEIKQQAHKKLRQQSDTLVKTTTVENPALDELMKKYSGVIAPKHEEHGQSRTRPAHQPSKIERSLKKKIRKL